MTDDLVRFRDVDPLMDWPEPDATINAPDGHPLRAHDPEKAMRMIAEMYRLGGFEFRASPDLAHMLLGKDDRTSAPTHGFHPICDESLAEDTVVIA